MRYIFVDPAELDKERMRKISGLELKGCMSMRLVVFKPNEKTTLRREYLCDCNECLALDFAKCTKNEDATCHRNGEEVYEDTEECVLDEDDGASQSMLYELIDTPSTVAVLSCSTSEPIYIIRVVEKGIAKSKIEDRFGHTILEGEYYLKGFIFA